MVFSFCSTEARRGNKFQTTPFRFQGVGVKFYRLQASKGLGFGVLGFRAHAFKAAYARGSRLHSHMFILLAFPSWDPCPKAPNPKPRTPNPNSDPLSRQNMGYRRSYCNLPKDIFDLLKGVTLQKHIIVPHGSGVGYKASKPKSMQTPN